MATKSGKTRNTIRMCLDETQHSMANHLLAMRKVLDIPRTNKNPLPQSQRVFTDEKGRWYTGTRLRASTCWAALDLPNSLTFVGQRRRVSTALKQVGAANKINN